jgi:sodium/hydrogen antiporter
MRSGGRKADIRCPEGKKVLAAVTLILVHFADASHVRFRKLAMNWQISARMLLVGMPLTLVLGKLIAYWLNPTPGLAMALLTAAVLPPTDAALGQSVVTSHQPERTQVK